jgi:hypothetical protein
MIEADTDAVRAVVDEFFAAFTSGSGLPSRMTRLRELFADGATVAQSLEDGITTYDVDSFVRPRQALLESGRLVDFREWVTAGRVDVFGDIAAWFGSYAKSGLLDGDPYAGRGTKSIQFVRTAGRWQIFAVAWCDERAGISSDGPGAPPDGLPVYRVLTGPDDATFCNRVSEALQLGYELHGGPAVTANGTSVVVAQALLWPGRQADAD